MTAHTHQKAAWRDARAADVAVSKILNKYYIFYLYNLGRIRAGTTKFGVYQDNEQLIDFCKFPIDRFIYKEVI